jgi:hypothetical protein
MSVRKVVEKGKEVGGVVSRCLPAVRTSAGNLVQTSRQHIVDMSHEFGRSRPDLRRHGMYPTIYRRSAYVRIAVPRNAVYSEERAMKPVCGKPYVKDGVS